MRPLIILGNPRSGTSLLRAVLNSHPEIYVAPESGFAHYCFTLLRDKKIEYSDLADNIFRAKKFEYWKISQEELNDLVINNPSNYQLLVKEIYIKQAAKEDKGNIKFWGDKNNYYVKHVDELEQVYKNACFIHIIRDGRDVACSYKKLSEIEAKEKYQPNLTGEIEKVAEEWSSNNSKVIEYLESDENHISIRYEDLVNNFEKTTNEISSFLKIENEFKTELKSDEPQTYFWKSDLNKKINADNIGKYKHILTTEEIETFNSIAHSILQKFNYLNG